MLVDDKTNENNVFVVFIYILKEYSLNNKTSDTIAGKGAKIVDKLRCTYVGHFRTYMPLVQLFYMP